MNKNSNRKYCVTNKKNSEKNKHWMEINNKTIYKEKLLFKKF